MFNIMVVTPKGRRTLVRVTQPVITAGKATDNAILLQGWDIAARHAEFSRTDQGVYVKNLAGAPNGVQVNGAPVERHGPLKASDKITIGSYTLYLREEGQEEGEGDAHTAAAPASRAAEPAAAAAAPAPAPAPAAPPPPKPSTRAESSASGLDPEARKELFRLMNEIHTELLKQIDLRRVDVNKMSDAELRARAKELLEEIIGNKAMPPGVKRDRLLTDMLNEVVGLGPLEALLADEAVSEIMVNRFDEVYIEQKGRLTKSDIVFSSDKAVMTVIERVVAPLGRRIDESSPFVDGRLKDGSRFNAIIPPLALRGPTVTIRKFGKNKLQAEDLVHYNSISPGMAEFFRMAVLHRKNIIISGGTGSGKTTLLNVLSNFIPSDERIVTVEDAAELRLNQPHLVSLESRPANMEGKGEVAIRDLVRNCLRMRPDRIVVGECRGGEALDMLQAMNTGHDGSLTTVHANAPRDAIGRIEVMVLMTGMDIPMLAIREQIASAVDLIIQQTRFACGTRKVTYISEVTGVEGNVVSLQDIFLFKQDGYGPDGKVAGRFVATGAIPDFYQELRRRGIEVDLSIFDSDKDKEL